ncbi:MAG: GNAT family N-acetyltransferase, partial [Bacteroidetes bacterium]|nr:GNAT family N-acetyltransferase [Bacteroidota bacterium]
EEAARAFWTGPGRETWVVLVHGRVAGTYFLRANQTGGGAHVCNCGYATGAGHRGQGIASLMCEHSQERAVEAGYRAMQFNFVVSTNEGAIRLWKRHGFEEVGRLPLAFEHPEKGLVDALVMYKWLI